jgi:hypothetical protein
MQEIAEAFKSAGLPGGFHDAAAEICERLACFKDQADPSPTMAAVLQVLGEKPSPAPSPRKITANPLT